LLGDLMVRHRGLPSRCKAGQPGCERGVIHARQGPERPGVVLEVGLGEPRRYLQPVVFDFSLIFRSPSYHDFG